MNETGPFLLRLAVLDAEDVAVLSTHAQDGHVPADSMAYDARRKRFALVMWRFDWEASAHGDCQRAEAGLDFARVLRVRRQGFVPGVPLNLLSVTFSETDAPSGQVTLTFSGGAAIRLDVECVEAELRDLGARRAADGTPCHDAKARR